MAEIAGLISSIITFIDFGFKVVAGAKDVRNSAQGMTAEVRELERIIRDAQHYNDLVKTQRASGQWFSDDELDVLGMVAECEELVRKLRELTSTLKTRTNARFRTLESTRILARTFLKEKEIKSLRSQLDEMAAQIWKHVANVMAEERHSSILNSLAEIRVSYSELDVQHSSKLDSITQDILALTKQTQEANEYQQIHRRQQLANLKAHLENLFREQAMCAQRIKLLKSLYFPELRRRWHQIPEAEKQTNEWIYDPQKTLFLSWLESQKDGDALFYITGKAGSGKSTLMKSIVENERTNESLRKWAGTSKLYTSEFYFWNQGTEMQKSGHGLFQSVLYQILRSTPDLIIPASKDRLGHEVWEMKELREAYQAIAQQTKSDAKFCFFIDGLDEYGGEEKEVVQLLQALSTVQYIKICASSRPGRLYESFLPHSGRRIDIANFTKEDMQTYVDANLRSSMKWQELVRTEPACQYIISEISTRAKGVWLWVFLVTRDIIKEADKGEGVTTLRRIVNEFPDDLHTYFERIIERIPKLHREEMAQILLIILEATVPLPVYAFTLLAKEAENEDYALNAPIRPLTHKEMMSGYPTWKKRLLNRCSDLLVVHAEYHEELSRSFPVEFLHRTVHDFLRKYDKQLKAYLYRESDPLLSLCKIHLSLLKSIPVSKAMLELTLSYNRQEEHIQEITFMFFQYAREFEKRNKSKDETPLVHLIDHLDMVNTEHGRVLLGDHTHWSNEWFIMPPRDPLVEEDRVDRRTWSRCNFLALVVEAGLVNYVRAKLATDQRNITSRGLLLDHALRPLSSRLAASRYKRYVDISMEPINISMIELLLNHGADPNECIEVGGSVCDSVGNSVWGFFLSSMRQFQEIRVDRTYQFSGYQSAEQSWYQAAHLLIRAGARSKDLDGGVRGTVSILNKVFGRDRASILAQEIEQREYEAEQAEQAAKQAALEENKKMWTAYEQRQREIEAQEAREMQQSKSLCVPM
ncbi:hypothetical protein F5Y08DRAFT_311690 [Xylaria arbuscula]|nr:hypothetical protein F5Y08DRAFT_311690 [Xylaria arbuscula]